jgi:hypothetical protein
MPSTSRLRARLRGEQCQKEGGGDGRDGKGRRIIETGLRIPVRQAQGRARAAMRGRDISWTPP